jgi:hypothetical protein
MAHLHDKNRRLHLAVLLILVFIGQGCTKIYYPYVPDVPPVSPYLPIEGKLNYVNVPPVVIPGSVMYTRQFSSQYFKIGVLPCKDASGGQRGADYKTPLADQINTALQDTKRFQLMDRGEFMDIDKITWKDVIRQGTNTDSIRETQDTGHIGLVYRRYMSGEASDRDYMEKLKDKCDGLLETTITSISQSLENAKIFIVGVECKIVSTNSIKENLGQTTSDDYTVLYARSHDIKIYTDKASGTIRADRSDVNKIADAIKESFPNPISQDSVHITSISEKTIKVNIGTSDNIQIGMMGFVVKISPGTNTLDYRARFVVTEVFPKAFAGRLLIEHGHEQEDRTIISQIKVGEPVRME